MHVSALCLTMPVAGSLLYASTGHPSRQVGSAQWLHPIEKYARWVDGKLPPSISPTRRQLIDAGLPFCSLQATTQHLQPMQLPMSTWKRYCSPGRGSLAGILASAGAGKRARDRTNLASSSVVRRSSGKGIDTPAVQNAVQSPYETPRRIASARPGAGNCERGGENARCNVERAPRL